MADFAVIHSVTRVIRRVTTEADHKLLPDEELIPFEGKLDLAAGPWKLDDKGEKVAATAEEFDAGMTLPHPPLVQDIVTALDAVLADAVRVPQSVRDLATALKVIYDRPRKLD